MKPVERFGVVLRLQMTELFFPRAGCSLKWLEQPRFDAGQDKAICSFNLSVRLRVCDGGDVKPDASSAAELGEFSLDAPTMSSPQTANGQVMGIVLSAEAGVCFWFAPEMILTARNPGYT